jgi:hypothetical protein
MHIKHWQDPVNAAVGVWLVISPWVLGFQNNSPALSNALIIGMALLGTALGAIYLPQAWQEWSEAGLGAWLLASPWVVGFETLQAATVNVAIAGTIVLVLALWVLAIDKDFGLLGDRAAH